MRSPPFLFLGVAVTAFMLFLHQPADAQSQAASSIPQSTDIGDATTFGYPTVAAALAALKARPDVIITENGGWTIVNDKFNNTIWSFTPANYPAYPAAVKRALVRDAAGNISLKMTGLCQAAKAPCDKLMDDFRTMNDRLKQNIQPKH